ncbi:MAG: hypothetical protein NZL98_02495 [Anaerolineales bacterium]|nr:hypothetical protein [Anaerolineales bacterium]
MALNWKEELEGARRARQEGNEGRARVCARRAAGAVAQDFLRRRGVVLRTTSAYEALQILEQWPALAPHLRQAAARLILRVDESFRLPAEIDLIEQAEILIRGLMQDDSD